MSLAVYIQLLHVSIKVNVIDKGSVMLIAMQFVWSFGISVSEAGFYAFGTVCMPLEQQALTENVFETREHTSWEKLAISAVLL